MHVMYLDDNESIHFGRLLIEDNCIIFTSKDIRIKLIGSKISSFGGTDDDYGITVVGFVAHDEFDDQFEHRTIIFYPDIKKMWNEKKN